MRRKDGQMFIHLINSAGATVAGAFRSTGAVPPTGALNVSVRMPQAPTRVVVEPEGTVLVGKYLEGRWSGTVPSFSVHAILRIETV
jgi:hypothetical protein